MNEEKMVVMLKRYADRLQIILERNDFDMKAVAEMSFHMRSEDPELPYMAITDRADAKTITRLTAQPTVKQSNLRRFFDLKVEGGVMPKYQLYIEDKKVRFTRRLKKGDPQTDIF